MRKHWIIKEDKLNFFHPHIKYLFRHWRGGICCNYNVIQVQKLNSLQKTRGNKITTQKPNRMRVTIFLQVITISTVLPRLLGKRQS